MECQPILPKCIAMKNGKMLTRETALTEQNYRDKSNANVDRCQDVQALALQDNLS